ASGALYDVAEPADPAVARVVIGEYDKMELALVRGPAGWALDWILLSEWPEERWFAPWPAPYPASLSVIPARLSPPRGAGASSHHAAATIRRPARRASRSRVARATARSAALSRLPSRRTGAMWWRMAWPSSASSQSSKRTYATPSRSTRSTTAPVGEGRPEPRSPMCAYRENTHPPAKRSAPPAGRLAARSVPPRRRGIISAKQPHFRGNPGLRSKYSTTRREGRIWRR